MRIESIHDKGVGAENEDALLIGRTTFGVFDGVTGRTEEGRIKKAAGKMASDIAAEVFSDETRTLKELAKEANNKRIALAIEGQEFERRGDRWGTTAAVVRLRRGKGEYFQLCDSFIMLLMRDGSYKFPAPFTNIDGPVMKESRKLADEGKHDILQLLMPTLIKMRDKRGIEFGVLDGIDDVEPFFNFGEFSLRGLSAILLFTDGLQIPQENPELEPDWGRFVKLFKQGGLKKLLNYVRRLEDSDPQIIKYPRYKLHDDATAIAISF